MGITRILIVLLAVPHVAFAEIPSLGCFGLGAEFTLDISPDAASFAYLDRTSEMQIVQHSIAEAADWPIAATAVGPRDSAIIIIEKAFEGTYPVRVLTQRGETPILLAGLCRDAP